MPNTIACIGDSPHLWKDWPGGDLNMTLNARLAVKYPGLSVINLGVNGDTAANINSTRKTAVDVYRPFRVVVWAGINDIPGGTSAATLQSDLQSIYNYYRVTKGYEVIALTILPRDDDTGSMNTVRNTVNNWIKNAATNVDRVIDAWLTIADPNDLTKRLPAYANLNSPNHMNDAGLAAIVNLFP